MNWEPMNNTSPLQKHRIIILFGSLDMGGAERQGLLLARHLKEQEGADLQVWGLGNRRGTVAEQCNRLHIPWRSIWLHWGIRRRFAHLLRLALALRQAQPDILLAYTKVPNLAAALLWRLCKVKLCVWNQADAGLLLEPTLLHRFAVSQVQRFIANADEGRCFLLDRYGLPEPAVRLIRNGVSLAPPLADRATWRRQLQAGEQTVIAVMVANLSRYKDHATLLAAWKLLLERHGSEPPPLLVLAGRFDDQTEALQHRVRELRIAATVRFTGMVDDVSGLLAAADLCVHSSRSEGIPNAVLEAMTSALPVVGSAIPGLREAVGDEGHAFLSPPGDAAALAKLLAQMMADPELRRRQGTLMQQRAEALFGAERMCLDTADYLAAALGEQS